MSQNNDLISRQDVIDALHTWFRDGFDEDKWWNSTHVLAAIEGLPSTQQWYKWETCFECPLSHGCPKIKGCTNEQAIEYASQIPNDCPLSAQPDHVADTGKKVADDDCISRQAAIDALDCISGVEEVLRSLPSAQPATNCSEIPNGSDDTISRQAALDMLDEQIELCNKALSAFDIPLKDEYAIKVERASLKAYKEQLENMLSAQPEQNGKWIYNSPTTMKCDRCGFAIKDWDWHRFKYCPNCRADMRGGDK